jgi:hypothetical protein
VFLKFVKKTFITWTPRRRAAASKMPEAVMEVNGGTGKAKGSGAIS